MTPDHVRKIAHLARITIFDADIPVYTQSLTRIMDLVEQMNRIDTTQVAPQSHSHDLIARMRDDQITESDERARMQSIAPSTEAGLYLVPKVIE